MASRVVFVLVLDVDGPVTPGMAADAANAAEAAIVEEARSWGRNYERNSLACTRAITWEAGA